MRTVLRGLLLLLLAFAISVPVSAQENKDAPKKDEVKKDAPKSEEVKKDAPKEDADNPDDAKSDLPPIVVRTLNQLKKLGLDKQQTLVISTIANDYGEKLVEAQKEARKEINQVLTPDQRKARAEARKKAIDDGKKGKELAKAIEDAVELSDEQKKDIEAAQAGVKKVQAAFDKAIDETLDDAQYEKLHGKKRDEGDKKSDEDNGASEKPKAESKEATKDEG